MPRYLIKEWSSESRYYTIEAPDLDTAFDKVGGSEPDFIKTHDREIECIETIELPNEEEASND